MVSDWSIVDWKVCVAPRCEHAKEGHVPDIPASHQATAGIGSSMPCDADEK